MNALVGHFLRDRSGATALEYALIIAVVCLVPMAAFGSGGEALVGLFDQASSEIAAVQDGSSLTLLPATDMPGDDTAPRSLP